MTLALVFNTKSGQAVVAGRTKSKQKMRIDGPLVLFSSKAMEIKRALEVRTRSNTLLVDETSLKIYFPSKSPTTMRIYMRLAIRSAVAKVTSILGLSDEDESLEKSLKAAKLDKVGIKNLEVLLTNEGGGLSVQVSGVPVLEAFRKFTIEGQIEAHHVGTYDYTSAFGLTVSKVSILCY